MSSSEVARPRIRIAVVESDPLRLVGFRALFEAEPEFELAATSLEEVKTQSKCELVLLGGRGGNNPFDLVAELRCSRPDLRVVVTGTGATDETILKALAAGAKGYVDEAAPAGDFIMAMRVVNSGSVWAPRRVLSMFIERVTTANSPLYPAGKVVFTDREQQVLELLVGGSSNREIGAVLNIEERTVKAHVAKLMRKVGVQNRIALSIHAITHSLVRNL
jgi:DNA-binding NarL/FixJ family response regulator